MGDKKQSCNFCYRTDAGGRGAGHQSGWEKPGLLACSFRCPRKCFVSPGLSSPVHCSRAYFSGDFFPSWNGLGAHFKFVGRSQELSWSLIFTNSFGPGFLCAVSTAKSRLPSPTPCLRTCWVCVCPCTFCLPASWIILGQLEQPFEISPLLPTIEAPLLIVVACNQEAEGRELEELKR